MKENILTINDGNDQKIIYYKSAIDNKCEKRLSLIELYEIFQKNNDDIFDCNTDDCLTFITDDSTEIGLASCWKYEKDKLMFLKISNDELKKADSEILIYLKKNYIENAPKLKFLIGEKLLSDTKLRSPEESACRDDLNGFMNTMRAIAESENGINDLPGIEYCMKQDYTDGLNTYHGYLPAIGQQIIIQTYIKMIRYVLENIGMQLPWMRTFMSSSINQEAPHTIHVLVESGMKSIYPDIKPIGYYITLKQIYDEVPVYPLFKQMFVTIDNEDEEDDNY